MPKLRNRIFFTLLGTLSLIVVFSSCEKDIELVEIEKEVEVEKIIRDTVTIINTQYIHDTTFVEVVQHDTVVIVNEVEVQVPIYAVQIDLQGQTVTPTYIREAIATEMNESGLFIFNGTLDLKGMPSADIEAFFKEIEDTQNLTMKGQTISADRMSSNTLSYLLSLGQEFDKSAPVIITDYHMDTGLEVQASSRVDAKIDERTVIHLKNPTTVDEIERWTSLNKDYMFPLGDNVISVNGTIHIDELYKTLFLGSADATELSVQTDFDPSTDIDPTLNNETIRKMDSLNMHLNNVYYLDMYGAPLQNPTKVAVHKGTPANPKPISQEEFTNIVNSGDPGYFKYATVTIDDPAALKDMNLPEDVNLGIDVTADYDVSILNQSDIDNLNFEKANTLGFKEVSGKATANLLIQSQADLNIDLQSVRDAGLTMSGNIQFNNLSVNSTKDVDMTNFSGLTSSGAISVGAGGTVGIKDLFDMKAAGMDVSLDPTVKILSERENVNQENLEAFVAEYGGQYEFVAPDSEPGTALFVGLTADKIVNFGRDANITYFDATGSSTIGTMLPTYPEAFVRFGAGSLETNFKNMAILYAGSTLENPDTALFKGVYYPSTQTTNKSAETSKTKTAGPELTKEELNTFNSIPNAAGKKAFITRWNQHQKQK